MSALAIETPSGEKFHALGCGCPSTGHRRACAHYKTTPPRAAHAAADPLNEVVTNWKEVLLNENEALYNDRWELVAKSRHMARNNSLLVGALNHKADAIVGTHFRVKPRINYKALGWNREEARDMEDQIKPLLKDLFYGRDKFIDARRCRTFTQGAAAALVSEMVNGDWMTKMEWITDEPERSLRTAFNLVDPCLLYTSPSPRD